MEKYPAERPSTHSHAVHTLSLKVARLGLPYMQRCEQGCGAAAGV